MAFKLAITTLMIVGFFGKRSIGQESHAEGLRAFEEKYSVEVITHGYPFNPAKDKISGADSKLVDDYLPKFLEEFSLYPPEFVKRSGVKKIVICKDLAYDGQLRAAVPGLGSGILYYDAERSGNYDSYHRAVVHHEYFHLVDWRDDRKLYVDEQWSALNPSDFKYGRGGVHVQADRTQGLTYDRLGFMNKYSTQGVEEDKAEIFSYLITEPKLMANRIKSDSVVAAKVKMMKQLMSSFSPSMDEEFWTRVSKVKRVNCRPNLKEYESTLTSKNNLAPKKRASQWETIEATGKPTARHEAALVAFKDKVYLIGGRRINPVDEFDPATNTWVEKSKTPLELHHFQAVVIDDAIYLIGAMTGPWPNEKPLEKIVVYYPETDKFDFVHTIPPTRGRGGAGAVAHDGKIYIVGGITNGHMDGFQNWLDVYDPKTGDWKPLPDAPHARDHFQAAVHGGKLFAPAGRTTSQKTEQGFDLTVGPTDVYDFEKNKWLPPNEMQNLPTHRAGNMAMVWKNELVIGGGESGSQKQAHNEVEALNLKTGEWQNWPSLKRGRHGSGFAIVGDYVYTASGCGSRGGSPELVSIERLRLPGSKQQDVSAAAGESKKETVNQWHTQTLTFEGPETSESADSNPFTDYRLFVTFKHSETTQTIRGFYAADGNAAETGADSGNKWQVRFAPDRVGQWTYSAELRRGDQIAIDTDPKTGEPIEITNSKGTFQVIANKNLGSDSQELDFRKRGRLIVDNGYFRFGRSGDFWLKGGADSPENLLAFVDFDGTFRTSDKAREGENDPGKNLHRFPTHVGDWKEGDPTWQDGKGKGLIGALNYLSSTGMNAVYFLTMNIGGDGKDVWPYASPDDFSRFDCSKLDQWEIVFNHMQSNGLMLHVVIQETENERLLDDGDTGPQRKLYLSELIARFAHHPAIVWNLGEENGPAEFSPNGQTTEQQKAMATYFKQADPYGNTVVIHTHAASKHKDHLLPGLIGHKPLDGLSFQVDQPKRVHQELIQWKNEAAKSGHEWLIAMDEIGKWDTGVVPDSVDANHDSTRHEVLWGTLMAGGAGVEWYFGANHPHNDLSSEDWRQRENMWLQTKVALDFFEQHLPYWEMKPSDDLTSAKDDYCFAKLGEVYAIYLPKPSGDVKSPVELNLDSSKSEFEVRWFSPKSGGELQNGDVTEIAASDESSIVNLGKPPNEQSQDWVVLVKAKK
jgi:N-acetylneuraminic acid mutarotase